MPDVALYDVDGYNRAGDGDDAASRESQQGIVRTVEVSMDWKSESPDSGMSRERGIIIPQAITDSECVR
jgi:hypothetical protein